MTADKSTLRHAIVLTAGLGTRLRPLTQVRAKPAVPVAGDPIIRRIIRWLAAHGITELVLNLHHLPETLTGLVGDGSDLAVRVRYSWEQPTVLGTAGGPRQALPLLGSDTFLIVNGDTFTDLDLGALVSAHATSGALVTLALVPNMEPHRYGGVRLGAGDVVAGFAARGPAAEGTCHFIGVQVASACVFQALTTGEAANSIGGVYDAFITERTGAIRGYRCDARFWDIGTPADYVRTCAAFSANPDRPILSHRAHVDRSARLVHSILWDDVEVGPGCQLERCVVTDRVRLPARSVYRDKILIASDKGDVVSYPLEV